MTASEWCIYVVSLGKIRSINLLYNIYLIPLALTDSNDRVGEDRD